MTSCAFELLERIARHATDSPRRVAFVEASSERALTFADLHERVWSIAGSFRPHSVVMLRCANRIEYPIGYLAILASGASVFPVSIRSTESELRALASGASASHIISHPEISALKTSNNVASPDASGEMLLASSGTTGLPKIVRRSLQSLDAVAVNTAEAIEFQADDTVLASVPLTHSYGVEHGLLAPLWAGSSVMLFDGFDPSSTRHSTTIFPAVPSMIEMMCRASDSKAALNSFRWVYTAGAPLPLAIAERFEMRIGQVYGMTEIGSVTFNSPASDDFDPASVGRPMQGVSILILGDGEIAVSSPSMLSGYIGEDMQLVDGHFPTGDIGRLDARGRLTITGRVRLLIDTGGMKINPIEVESVISTHPEVRECVILPVQQSETVNRLCAVIVPRNAASPPTDEAIRRFARERLAGYKVPRLIVFRDNLPRTASGKVIRRPLQEMALET